MTCTPNLGAGIKKKGCISTQAELDEFIDMHSRSPGLDESVDEADKIPVYLDGTQIRKYVKIVIDSEDELFLNSNFPGQRVEVYLVNNSKIVVTGSAKVYAQDNSTVEAHGSSGDELDVNLIGHSKGEFSGNVSFVLQEDASAKVGDNVQGHAIGKSKVVATGNSIVKARGSSHVKASGHSKVLAEEKAVVILSENASMLDGSRENILPATKEQPFNNISRQNTEVEPIPKNISSLANSQEVASDVSRSNKPNFEFTRQEPLQIFSVLLVVSLIGLRFMKIIPKRGV